MSLTPDSISVASLALHLHDLPPGGKKVYILSLGCPKNLVDTERYTAVLAQHGYSVTSAMEEADLFLVNTCGFIDNAKQESLDALFEVSNAKRDDQTLIVAGCLVDRYRGELAEEFPQVDAWIDLPTFADLEPELSRLEAPSLPDGFLPLPLAISASPEEEVPWAGTSRIVLTPRHTAYLKISEGCDHTCAFCAIPSFKGKQRSVPLETLVDEAHALVAQGALEITLIGQDTVAYGRDFGDRRATNLRTLLERLNEIENLQWIRVLYTYPTRLADELEWAYSQLPKVIPYLDLPLQHLSDPVLERMRRGTPYASIRDHVSRLRASVPDLVVRSTCIVGFPGETRKDFELLQTRFAELGVDHLGVFPYSDEEGTHAEGYDRKVSEPTRKKRHLEMTEWAASFCQGKAQHRIGTTCRILVDHAAPFPADLFPQAIPEGRWWVGRWWGQAPEIDGGVYFQSESAQPGEFLQVTLREASYPDYLGVAV
jgi:ribosomal protein S12 methylthiotransferase